MFIYIAADLTLIGERFIGCNRIDRNAHTATKKGMPENKGNASEKKVSTKSIRLHLQCDSNIIYILCAYC